MTTCLDDYNLLMALHARLAQSVPAQSLASQSARKSVQRLVRLYRYAVRDALEMNYVRRERSPAIDYIDHFLRATKLEPIVKCERCFASLDRFAGDLVGVLLELETLYETQVQPMAQLTRLTLPMLYRRDFTFRTPVRDETATGPMASVEGRLEGTVAMWDENAIYDSDETCIYNRGLFFAPPSRITTTVTFDTSCARILNVSEQTVGYSIFTVDLHHDQTMHELLVGAGGNVRLQLLCQRVSSNRAALALAASLRSHRNVYGDTVVTIDWIDGVPLVVNNLDVNVAAELYQCEYRKKCWRVIMGNGCKIDVCVTLSQDPPLQMWTLTNDDGNETFDECASLLRNYYRFQCCTTCGGTDDSGVHPLEPVSVQVFAALYAVSPFNLSWLIGARLDLEQREPLTAIVGDRSTSQFLHVAALQGIVRKLGRDVEYARFDNICVEPI